MSEYTANQRPDVHQPAVVCDTYDNTSCQGKGESETAYKGGQFIC